jgi:uncharacterized protein
LKIEPEPAYYFEENDGRLLVLSVREAIKNYLKSSQVVAPTDLSSDSRFEQKRGCFVTLKSNDGDKSLRGCIGFPEPILKLSKALVNAAIAAAIEDPRFHPIKLDELDSLLVEVSILTPPENISVKSPMELPSMIRVGKDGLIMRWTYGSGLLLPQVAKEYNWDAKEFLANLSMKAGAPPDQWLVPGTIVSKFQAQVFQETEPNGPVVLEK